MIKYIFTLLLVMGILNWFEVLSQGVALNNDNSTPDPSSMLDVKIDRTRYPDLTDGFYPKG